MTELQRLLDEAGTTLGPGLFGLVTDGGEVVFSGSTGVADLRSRRAIGPQDRFRIGSVTKVYVAAVALQLLSEEIIDLADPVEKWLPGLIPDGEQTTVEHLLRMRSGLPHYIDTLYGSPIDFSVFQRYWTPEELVQASLRTPGRTAPGAEYRYSSTDYVVLGLILERATGRRADALLWERIFAPLHLDQTSLPVADPQIRGPHASGYVKLPGQDFLDSTRITPSEAFTAGAIVSTPADVARFLDALLGGDLLDAERTAFMLDCREVVDGARGRGVGIVCYDIGGVTAYGHQGGVAGYRTTALRTPEGRCVVLYENGFDATVPMPPDLPFVAAALRA